MQKVKTALKRAENLAMRLHAERKAKKTEINRLKRQGASAGAIVWQEKRPGYNVAYLYHSTSSVEGVRIREYIGTDKRKINAAIKRIERAARIVVLSREVNDFSRALERMQSMLKSVMDVACDVSKGQSRMW